MYIERLYAERFRNIERLELLPHPRVNILEGDNGQGKTNVLEAIVVLASLRSFRTGRLSECIEFDADQSSIASHVQRGGASTHLGVQLGRRRHRVFVDGKAASTTSSYAGRLVAVLFGPGDLALPHADPALRRRWLDRVIFNHHPIHLADLRRYERGLASRNALLKQHRRGSHIDVTLIDVYDRLVAEHGAVVSERRATFVADFDRSLAAVFGEVASPGLVSGLRYVPRGALKDAVDVEARRAVLASELAERRSTDLRLGYTTRGPHLDDVVFELNGRPARVHASQGQCRALVLAAKIAEITSLERSLGESPVLLLDDVSSELDAERNRALMAHLEALGGQVFLTTTAARHIRVASPRRVFLVRGGEVHRADEIDVEEKDDGLAPSAVEAPGAEASGPVTETGEAGVADLTAASAEMAPGAESSKPMDG